MIQLLNSGGKFVSLAHFDANGALPSGGQADRGRQKFADPIGAAQPFEPGLGQHNRVVIALRQLSQARVHVSAHLDHYEIAAMVAQLRLAPQAAGAHAGPARQLIELEAAARDERVARVFPFADGRDLEPRRKSGRHVFHAVDGQIDALLEQRVFQFLGENSLAADFAQRALPVAISRGADDDEFGGRSVPRQSGAHVFRLPASERAASRANPQGPQGLPWSRRKRSLSASRFCILRRRSGTAFNCSAGASKTRFSSSSMS